MKDGTPLMAGRHTHAREVAHALIDILTSSSPNDHDYCGSRHRLCGRNDRADGLGGGAAGFHGRLGGLGDQRLVDRAHHATAAVVMELMPQPRADAHGRASWAK
jgi:hypothetical protein